MAKKPSRKSQSWGPKPKGMVSTKKERTPYGIARDAIYLKMVEDTHAQVFGRISKSQNIQEEYATALRTLDLTTTKDDAYDLCLLRQELEHKQNVLDRVIAGNLLRNHVANNKIRNSYPLFKSLTADIKRPRQL